MTNAEILKNWMDSIPYGIYGDVRQKIIDECRTNKSTYGNWRNGTCAIPVLAQEKIEAISVEYAEKNIGHAIKFEKEKTQMED